MEKKKTVLICAGEASGDLHASSLVKAIKKITPETEFFGLGGQKSNDAGVKLYHDIVGLAVVGFFEVIKKLPEFKSIFKGLLAEVDRKKPDLAILVDYPGFNLRLAEQLKKRNIPVIYYISPQIWAWGSKRINLIKKVVDHMIVVFKFEEELYAKHGIKATFVGHPLLDIVKDGYEKNGLLSTLPVKNDTAIFALLPGSREKEIKILLPIMLETSKLLYDRLDKNAYFLILRSPTVNEGIFSQITGRYNIPLKIISGSTYEGISASGFAIVASGTATLETAILGKPMVILYKVSFFTWAILRLMIKIPYIGLVNVVANKKIAAEFIQYAARPDKICSYIISFLKDRENTLKARQDLRELKDSLGGVGASVKAAQIVAAYLAK